MARLLIILALLLQPVTFGLAAMRAASDCQPPATEHMSCCCGDASSSCGCVVQSELPALPESAMPSAPTDAPSLNLAFFWVSGSSLLTSPGCRSIRLGDSTAALPASSSEARSLLCVWLT